MFLENLIHEYFISFPPHLLPCILVSRRGWQDTGTIEWKIEKLGGALSGENKGEKYREREKKNG